MRNTEDYPEQRKKDVSFYKCKAVLVGLYIIFPALFVS